MHRLGSINSNSASLPLIQSCFPLSSVFLIPSMRHTLAAKGKILLFVLCVLGLFAGFLYRKYRPPWEFYRELATVELGESKSLLGASGSGQRYVKFKQLQGAGFNNQAQEIHLFHHLALLTNRVYVYQPFMWRHRMELQPLSGFLLGPTQGSLSSEVWDEVCPLEKVKNVTFDAEYEHRWRQATEGLDGPDECIYVENWILNWGFLESTAIHEIWPEYRKYLHSRYRWPSHIADMIHRSQTQLNLRPEPSSTEGESYLALHFRRGDFEEHCQHLARTNQSFTSWTTLPEIQSTSVFPPRLDPFTPSSVVEHCYPDLRRILEAIDTQIRFRPHIRAIYVLHDGAWDHIPVYTQFYRTRSALRSSKRAKKAGWTGPPGGMKHVTHSGMIPVQNGERDWKVAVDIELARRAEVFIGNGYSSLTSQIVALRLADGGKADDITIM